MQSTTTTINKPTAAIAQLVQTIVDAGICFQCGAFIDPKKEEEHKNRLKSKKINILKY